MPAARVPGLPRPEIALVAAVAAGAALGALAGPLTAAVPSLDAVTADLHLRAGHDATAAADTTAPADVTAPALRDVMPAVTPANTASTATTATAALAKSAQRNAHAAEVETAIDRFQSRIGTTRYEGYCERAVENAYGTQGHYASAIDDWHAREQHSDWRHAPRGALVFYNTSANGHVAISLGDGRVVSSSAHHQVGIVPVDFFQHPLGWAPSPY
jgi:cell wall-associated NlpC family hydrolase